MQATITLILLLFVVTVVSGQHAHPLVPGTKGNRIELSVANESATTVAENVEVKLVRNSSHVAFASTDQVVQSIQPAEEVSVVFMFDVARNAPMNKRDTLEFNIKDKSGASWTKSIIVSYTGPASFALDQNYPNPFNPTTTIQYQLPTDSRISLKVYDVLGREVTTLVQDVRPAGYHDAQWDAGNVASGVYFCRMEAQPLIGGSGFQQIKKLMVLK